jgi:hypothetical protein
MGGAFVAVANDSSATWWNPGALPAGPFFDMGVGRATTDSSRELPARRDRVGSFAMVTPPFGFSYYRVRITETAPTASGEAVRQDEQGTVPVRSLSVSEIGVTLGQTLLTGVHIGTTLKYVRGSTRAGVGDAQLSVPDLLDEGEDLDDGETDHEFDWDIGVLASAGPLRAGLVIRNVQEVTLGRPEAPGGEFRLPRQVRVGAAFGPGFESVDALPLTVSLDVDVVRYPTVSGDRRVVAVGAEHWLVSKRLALRGGGRLNTVGAEDRAATAGITVGLGRGAYVDGHLVRGGSADDRGWGLAARMSF